MYFVVDTNCFLVSLPLIESFVRNAPENITLCVPSVVVSELDGLKSASGKVGSDSRRATRYILSALHSNVQFILQPTSSGSQTDTNDNKILEYCNDLMTTSNQIVLFSNDNNLCLKSAAFGIATISNFRGDANELIAQLNSHFMTNSLTACTLERDADIDMDIAAEYDQDIHMDLHETFDDFMVEFHEKLVRSLSQGIESKYNAKFGQQWEKMVPEKPWSLNDIVSMIKSDWIVVFDEYLPESIRQSVSVQLLRLSKDLNCKIDQHKAMTMGDLCLILDLVMPIVECICPSQINAVQNIKDGINLLRC